MNTQRRRALFISGGAALLAASSLWLAGCRGGGGTVSGLRKGRDFNVVLITLDTLRADSLGCYGNARVKTPVIDGLARRGLRFDRCVAQAPLTLPSHTTLMTGTFPPFHGVRDNGGAIVPAGLETMAEVFKAHGYQTAAFVAAYVLDSRWGLNQGFDTYFDQFDLTKRQGGTPLDVQRPANEVIDAALPWLEREKADKFFVWVHLYDPHIPYRPPAPYDQEYADQPYLGEIAFADAQIGRLMSFLESNGLLDRTFIVFAGDHGEALGQHEEKTHGFFVYQETLRVPLIISTPFRSLAGRVSARTARLADVMPTVLDMCGWPSPSQVQGTSLSGEFRGKASGPAEPAYAESYYPRDHFGWSELRSVQDDRYQLIVAPDLELYDLVADPGELTNIAPAKPEVARSLRAQAEELTRRYGRNAFQAETGPLDAAAREKLGALGYLGSTIDRSRLEGRDLADPKSKIDIYNRLNEAQVAASEGRAGQAAAALREIIAREPDIIDAHFALGSIFLSAGSFEEAIPEFEKVLALNPRDTFTALDLAVCRVELGQPDRAETFILDYLKTGPQDPELYLFLGRINYNQGKLDQAAAYYEKALALSPASAITHNWLAAVEMTRGDLPKAEAQLREAVRLNPRLAGLHYNLGQVLLKEGQAAEAEADFKTELEFNPSHFQSALVLSLIARQRKNEAAEMAYLDQAIQQGPNTLFSDLGIAQFCLERGARLEQARDLVLKALDLRPQGRMLADAYALLSRIYDRMGDSAKAREYARLAAGVHN
jgi:arylsulfatase A-like enzyme/predicted Zn-dependent protease